MDWRKLLLSPQGRIGRKSYWLFLGGVLGLGFVIILIEMALFHSEDGPISAAYNFGTIWFWICVGTKRLHDLGLSGWWQVPGYGALFAVIAVASATWGEGGMYLAFFIALLALLGLLGAIRGRPTANKYGEPNSGDRVVTPIAEAFS